MSRGGAWRLPVADGEVRGGRDLRDMTKGHPGATASLLPFLGQGGGGFPSKEREIGE